MPPVDPPSGTVMIEDENSIQRPWSIIPRPERMPKNPRIREIMELGLGSNAEPEADLPNDDETTKAQKAIYRGIWSGIRTALNAVVPGAFHGKLLWKDITTAQRNAVRMEVLEHNPYLRRFQGGWLEELIMMTQLSNSRDTYKRRQKNASGSQLKPLERLSKKSHSQTKKRSLEPHKDWEGTRLSPGQATMPSITTPDRNRNSDGTPPRPRPRPLTITPDRNSNSNSNGNGNGIPFQPQPRTPAEASQVRRPSTSYRSPQSNQVQDSVSNQVPSNAGVSDTGERQNTLLSYFSPKLVTQLTSTTSKKRPGAYNQDKEVNGDDSESSGNDEDWSRSVDSQIAASKSKALQSASSSVSKKTPAASKESSATISRSRARPKPRPPPGNDTGDGTTTDLFRRTTRAAKQEMIDEAEEKEGTKGKGKSSMTNPKGRGNKKKRSK